MTGLGAWVVGEFLCRNRWRLPHPALQIASDTGLGLLLLSCTLYAASMSGFVLGVPLVSVPMLRGLFAVMTLLALVGGSGKLRAAHTAWPRGGVWVAAVIAGLSAYAAWIVSGAMLPITSLDEMVYHLEIPKRILEVGYLPPFTDNVLAYYPMGPQMLFLYGLGIAGETAARLFHGLYGLLVLLAIYGYARTLVDRTGAVIAATLFATVPTVMVIGAWAYIDMNFTLYAFLALVGTLLYTEARETSEWVGLPWAVYAGLLAGAAWTVKYTGLQLVLLLALVVLVAELRSRTGKLPWGLVALGGLAFLLFVPHLARTWAITGWPLFPFGLGPFELTGAVNWSIEQSDLALAWQRQYGAGYDRNLFERLMSSIWVYTSAEANYTAYDGVVGSVFLLAPLALVARRRSPQVTLLAVFVATYTFYWSLTTTQVRFLIPLLPVMAVLVAVAVSDRLVRFCRSGVAVCIGISVLLAVDSLVPLLVPARGPGVVERYWRGDITRTQFLERRLGPYGLYMEATRRLGPGDRLYMVNMRTWGYLLDLPGRGEMWPYPNGWRSDYTFEHFNLQNTLVAATAPSDIDAFFASRGVTHIMIDEGVTLGEDGLEGRERSILVDYFQRRGTLLFRNPRDLRQSLWKLNLPGGGASP
ncbi:MAG: hypothetical protein GKS06_15095 [Acidobacteria bacterium]|nr:hypothetical protein [Acidobacteriota bacterium]